MAEKKQRASVALTGSGKWFWFQLTMFIFGAALRSGKIRVWFPDCGAGSEAESVLCWSLILHRWGLVIWCFVNRRGGVKWNGCVELLRVCSEVGVSLLW